MFNSIGIIAIGFRVIYETLFYPWIFIFIKKSVWQRLATIISSTAIIFMLSRTSLRLLIFQYRNWFFNPILELDGEELPFLFSCESIFSECENVWVWVNPNSTKRHFCNQSPYVRRINFTIWYPYPFELWLTFYGPNKTERNSIYGLELL